MEQFIQIFGDKTIGWGVAIICVIVFLVGCYRKVGDYFSNKAINEKTKDDRIQEVIDQAKQYPAWHQQSIDIREQLDRRLGNLDTKIDSVSNALADMKKANGEQKANSCRYRILRFDDEIRHDEHHSKEHFDQILEDITEYTTYCDEHPSYKNSKANLAIENIRRIYLKCCEECSFL